MAETAPLFAMAAAALVSAAIAAVMLAFAIHQARKYLRRRPALNRAEADHHDA
ncbi:hypothetical protein [Methylorubrum aminovorans]